MKKKYFVVGGAVLGPSSKRIQAIGEWMDKIPEKTPESIVRLARSANSPAHSYFDWDDTVARLEVAG